MSWVNPVHSNPSTNQLTEKKHSKWKAPYRLPERTEPLKRKAGWKTEAQSVKRSTQKRKEHSQVSIRTKTTRSWVEEGLRECHMKNQSKEIGALRSDRKQPPRRTGQKRPKKQPEKAALRGERCPWKRATMKKNLVKNLKSQRKTHKRKNMYRKKQ